MPGSKLLSVESISLLPREKEFIIDRRGTFTVTSFLPDFEEPFYGRIDKYLITYVPDVLSTITSPASTFPLLDSKPSSSLPPAPDLASFPPSPPTAALLGSPASSTLSPQESPWDVLSEDERKLKKPRYK